MAFDDVRMKKVSGSLPEFGAIFMSNRNTKEECFSRRLFGLPLSSADFVKKVRAGMVLFLFEYEQRKLYGVFEAISDGAIDTVPQAYQSSGKLFRAQVQFRVIWKCYPLLEHDFCNAIKDNYYAANKFNFGLSKEQVRRLLCLFESTKVRVHKTLTRKVKKSRSRSSDEWYAFGDYRKLRVEANDFTVNNKVSSGVSHSGDTGTSNFHPQTFFVSDATSKSAHEFICHSRGSPNLSHGDPEQVNVSSNSASSVLKDYVPLPSPHHSHPVKAPSVNSPKVKGLYSDSPQKRASAFSRLRLVTETAAKEKTYNSEIPERTLRVLSRMKLASKAVVVKRSKENFEEDDSMHEITEKLQQRHDNWRITKKNAGKTVHGDENISLNKKRSSVFSRLSYTSEATAEEKNFNAKLGESFNNNKEMLDRKERKRVRKVVIQSDGNYENSSNMTTIQVTIQGDGKMSESGWDKEGRGGSVWLPEEDHKKRILSSDGSSVGKEKDETISKREKKVKVESKIRRVTRGEESNKEEKCKGLTNVGSDQLGDQVDGGRTTDNDVVPIPFKTYLRRRLSASPSCVKYADMEVVVDVAKIERFEASFVDAEEEECCEQDAEQELEFFL